MAKTRRRILWLPQEGPGFELEDQDYGLPGTPRAAPLVAPGRDDLTAPTVAPMWSMRTALSRRAATGGPRRLPGGFSIRGGMVLRRGAMVTKPLSQPYAPPTDPRLAAYESAWKDLAGEPEKQRALFEATQAAGGLPESPAYLQGKMMVESGQWPMSDTARLRERYQLQAEVKAQFERTTREGKRRIIAQYDPAKFAGIDGFDRNGNPDPVEQEALAAINSLKREAALKSDLDPTWVWEEMQRIAQRFTTGKEETARRKEETAGRVGALGVRHKALMRQYDRTERRIKRQHDLVLAAREPPDRQAAADAVKALSGELDAIESQIAEVEQGLQGAYLGGPAQPTEPGQPAELPEEGKDIGGRFGADYNQALEAINAGKGADALKGMKLTQEGIADLIRVYRQGKGQ